MSDVAPLTPATPSPLPLAEHIERHVVQYFEQIGDAGLNDSHDLYALMLTQFEKPLLAVVYQQTAGNQTLMAQILGLNRGTLRKKLKQHGLIA